MIGFFLITFLFLEKEKDKRLFGFSVLISVAAFIFYNSVIHRGTVLVNMDKFFIFLFLFSISFLLWKMLFNEREYAGFFQRYITEYFVLPLQAILSIYFSGVMENSMVTLGDAHGLLYANCETLDYLLYAFDASLNIPIYTAFSWWGKWPWTHIPISQVYACLIGLMMYSQYLQRRNPHTSSAEIVLTFTLAGLLGILLYKVIPAVACAACSIKISLIQCRLPVPTTSQPALTFQRMLCHHSTSPGHCCCSFMHVSLVPAMSLFYHLRGTHCHWRAWIGRAPFY